MRGQAIIISAVLATIIIILFFAVIYREILPRSTIMEMKPENPDIESLVYSRKEWSEKELAQMIFIRYGYDYVKVEITEIDLSNGFIVKQPTPYTIGDSDGLRTHYYLSYSIVDRNAVMTIYEIEVGRK